jgi:hypothetical protein
MSREEPNATCRHTAALVDAFSLLFDHRPPFRIAATAFALSGSAVWTDKERIFVVE